MTDSKPFAGKLALVTGASRGIGAATAEALAAAGAHVILVARTASALEEVEERIHAAGGSATIAPLDLTDGEAIGKLAGSGRRALEEARHPRPQRRDARLADAGPGHRSQGIFAAAEHQFARQPGADRGLRSAAARRPIEADVVALTSSVGGEPRAFWGAYGSSKAALESLLGAYADETAYLGRIKVHIVDPGATRTRMRATRLPGRGAGERQAAGSRRRGDRRAAARGCAKHGERCGSKPSRRR